MNLSTFSEDVVSRLSDAHTRMQGMYDELQTLRTSTQTNAPMQNAEPTPGPGQKGVEQVKITKTSVFSSVIRVKRTIRRPDGTVTKGVIPMIVQDNQTKRKPKIIKLSRSSKASYAPEAALKVSSQFRTPARAQIDVVRAAYRSLSTFISKERFPFTKLVFSFSSSSRSRKSKKRRRRSRSHSSSSSSSSSGSSTTSHSSSSSSAVWYSQNVSFSLILCSPKPRRKTMSPEGVSSRRRQCACDNCVARASLVTLKKCARIKKCSRQSDRSHHQVSAQPTSHYMCHLRRR